MKFHLIFVVSLFLVTTGKELDYSGQMVVSVVGKSAENLAFLETLESFGMVKFWDHPSSLNSKMQVQMSANSFNLLSEILNKTEMEPHLDIPDIQKLIDQQKHQIAERRFIVQDKAFDFENFHRYNELVAFLQVTAANNTAVTFSTIGTTFEGREIAMVSLHVGNTTDKPTIMLECGIHAREWVSPATCIWIFDQLVNGYGEDTEISRLLDIYDWLIVPSTNPDGYEYSWTTDRLWRKNRFPNGDLGSCTGVDLNRNFAANFGGLGSDSNFCSEVYHGTAAFSEPESAAIRDVLATHHRKIIAYVSLHSYAQLWMTPYGYIADLPVEYDEMLRVMEIGVDAIAATYGTVFSFGNEADLLYLTSGTTRDYAYIGENITYSYTIEARSLSYGFIAPPSEILPTAQEIWNGIKAMAFALP